MDMIKKSVTIRAAWIGVLGLVIAAILTGLISWLISINTNNSTENNTQVDSSIGKDEIESNTNIETQNIISGDYIAGDKIIGDQSNSASSEKRRKIEPPIFRTGLINLPRKYKVGLEINNTIWQEDYQFIRFIFKYPNVESNLSDFKIDIQFPAGVVNFKIIESSGFDNLNVFTNPEHSGIGNSRQVNEIVKSYSNHLFINSIQVIPNAQLTLEIILKPALDHNNGFVKYDFYYLNEMQERLFLEYIYPMPYSVKDDFLYFDVLTDTDVTKYDYNLKTVYEKPLIFTNDGHVKN
jgi:hypothetical protein